MLRLQRDYGMVHSGHVLNVELSHATLHSANLALQACQGLRVSLHLSTLLGLIGYQSPCRLLYHRIAYWLLSALFSELLLLRRFEARLELLHDLLGG